MRVLVAEDEPLDRELLVAYLVHWGHDPEICSDGHQAWQRLRQPDPPRLLLLDWMMPGLDGVELCRRVRQEPLAASTYILLVTGRSRREDLVQGLRAGADDYVIKPYDGAEMQARVQVGVRVVELSDQLLRTERLQVMMQTAGAAAHEINQPLSVLLGQAQLMLRDKSVSDSHRGRLDTMVKEVRRISGIVQRMTSVTEYVTRSYAGNDRIVDFGPEEGPPQS